MASSQYLPDEMLLEVLSYVALESDAVANQAALARFCAVNRQWYDVGIHELYASPYLAGHAYDLFVRTICPSVLAHIKPTALSNLVKVLDLSHIVHQGNKSVTARLLGRTKSSLRAFVAPQASFAINCWASLSKCRKLRVLDLSLVSECISFQSLSQTLRQLPDVQELRLPRCSASLETEGAALAMTMRWPPHMRHLSLSGPIFGRLLWNCLQQTENFPPSLSSLSISHSPGLDHMAVGSLFRSLSSQLTRVSLCALPHMRHGRLNAILDWLPHLTDLTIALDYIDTRFGNPPDNFSPELWAEAKPLESLTLVASGQTGIDPARSFTAVDLHQLIDDRFLGRLRWLNIARSTEWERVDDGAEVGALEMLLEEVDMENWAHRRWHFADLVVPEGMDYYAWARTPTGQRMKAELRMLNRTDPR